MRSNIKEKGRWRVIDRVSANLNDQDNQLIGAFARRVAAGLRSQMIARARAVFRGGTVLSGVVGYHFAPPRRLGYRCVAWSS